MPDLGGLYTGVLLVCSGSFAPHWTCDFHSGSLTLVSSTKSRIDPCLSARLLGSSFASSDSKLHGIDLLVLVSIAP